MKKFILSLVVGMMLGGSASATSVEFETLARCHDTVGLPSGFSLVISKEVESQQLSASFTNRDNIGPFVNLGTIPVERKIYPPEQLGAPITYVGENFELNINRDAPARPDGTYYAHVYAVLQGRTFDEAIYCTVSQADDDDQPIY